jgi:hypothetical protein
LVPTLRLHPDFKERSLLAAAGIGKLSAFCIKSVLSQVFLININWLLFVEEAIGGLTVTLTKR